MPDDLYSFAKFMGAFREGRDRRKRERIATMRDRLDYANRLRDLPVVLPQDSMNPPLPPEPMNVEEIRATPPSLEQTEVLDDVQEAMQQPPSDPPEIESIAGEGNTPLRIYPPTMTPLEPEEEEETEDQMLERRRLRDLEWERQEKEEERKRLEAERRSQEEERAKEKQPDPPAPKPEPKPDPKPDPKPKEVEDQNQKEHNAAIAQMTKPKPPKEEKPSLLEQLEQNSKKQTPVKEIEDERPMPAPSSKTSEKNKKTLASAMKDKKVEPKKTSSKEPEAKKKEDPKTEDPKTNKNNALARAMELKQKREKKAKDESKEKETPKPKAKSKPKAKEEKPAEPEEDPNEMRFVLVQGKKGLSDEKISREEAKKRGYHLKATYRGQDVWVDKSQVEEKKDSPKKAKKEEKKDPPKKEEKKESLNTELKEGAKELTSDEKVANLLGTGKKKMKK